MLYLALSSLQGTQQGDAARKLYGLAPGEVGLQLTPGLVPDPIDVECPTRTHHGFTTKAYRARVWKEGQLVWRGDSVHPPLRKHVDDAWEVPHDVVMETMYPGYADLSTGQEIERAMDMGRWLAVDVAHLQIQQNAGALSDVSLNRILQYDRIAEVHVSTSDGVKDVHGRVNKDDFGVEWALERMRNGTPLILECYMHRLTHEQRKAQVEVFL